MLKPISHALLLLACMGRTQAADPSSLDILPTALAASGASADPQLEGVNLLPYLTDDKTGAPHTLLGWRFGKQRAIRMGDWKLLDMGQGWQLYNLSNDIAEKHDLSQQEPAKLQELEAAYTKWNAKNIPAGWLMHGVPTKSRIPHRQQIDNMKDEGHERSAASGE